MQLGIGKSVVIDLPRDIKDVLVAEPKFANAVVRSTRRAYLIGVAVGQTNIYFFDAEGKQIAGFDVAVTRDLNGVRAMLQKLLPNSDVRVDGVGDGVMLSGSVANAAEVAAGLRRRGAPRRQRRQGGQQSHHPRPRPGDAQGDGRRSAARRHQAARHRSQRQPELRQRGAQLQQRQSVHGAGPAAGRRQRHHGHASRRSPRRLRAMERAGVIRTLAEPNLTAISGESANFLAGGEFPVPAGYTCDPTTRACQLAIQFKKFGVGLNFTPVVLSEGRISLKVMTEVSELSNENSIQLVQGTGHADHSGDQDPPRRDHGRNSLRRRARDGGHDPGADQAADQRPARPDAASGARHAVQEPRLRQPPDRADGDRHAVHRARGGAEGSVAAG